VFSFGLKHCNALILVFKLHCRFYLDFLSVFIKLAFAVLVETVLAFCFMFGTRGQYSVHKMSKSNEVIPMESKNGSIRKHVETVSIKMDANTKMNENNSVMSFHNVAYEVGVKSGCCKKEPKTIVKGVRYVELLINLLFLCFATTGNYTKI